MRRTIALVISAILFVSMLVLGVVSKMQAQQGQQGQACTLGTLNGAYGVRLSGFRIATPSGPTASVATATFNGAGGILNGVSFNNTNGSVGSASFTGTYTVDPNCTGSIFITAVVNNVTSISTADFVIVAGGKEIQILETTPGIVDSGVAIKQ